MGLDLNTILASALGAALQKAVVEEELDAMEPGDKETFDAPAALIIKGVIKRKGFVYDITGYQLRKRAR